MQIFCFLYFFGSGNISYIYPGEICIDQGAGLSVAMVWTTEIILSVTIPFMIDSNMGVAGAFYFYAALNFIGTIYCLCLKETRGLTPIQLEELYRPKALKTQVAPAEVQLAEKTV